jgi:cytoskeletal protein CcmA (bactofilin family)
MALFRKEQPLAASSGNVDTILGASANVQGVLKSDGNIRVDGILQGRIETAGNVVIGPSAKVVADISANSVQVWGHVQGNIRADGRLEILSTGRVFGELCVSALMIDRGGLFRGQCYMSGQDADLLECAADGRLLLAGAAEEESAAAKGEQAPSKLEGTLSVRESEQAAGAG